MVELSTRRSPPQVAVVQRRSMLASSSKPGDSKFGSTFSSLSQYFSGVVHRKVIAKPKTNAIIIPMVFENYPISTPMGEMPLGHAGVLIIHPSGKARYFEFGRYDGAERKKKGLPPGKVRSKSYTIKMKGGKPEPASLASVLGLISTAHGKGSDIKGAYLSKMDYHEAIAYADGLQKRNTDPTREAYSLLFGANNCISFAVDTAKAGGASKLDYDVSPDGSIPDLQKHYPDLTYDAKQKSLSIEE